MEMGEKKNPSLWLWKRWKNAERERQKTTGHFEVGQDENFQSLFATW